MVETLSNLVSHANATIQLNALWGLMVSGGREGGKGGEGRVEKGRKGGREEREKRGRRGRGEREGGRKKKIFLKLPSEYTVVLYIYDRRIGLCNESVMCSLCLQSVAYDSGGDVKSRIKQSLGLETLFE